METKEFLVETALLMHGLSSIQNNYIQAVMPPEVDNLCWVETGKIKVGQFQEFARFRSFCSVQRLDYNGLINALNTQRSGVLTASGTIRAAEILGRKLVISSGIGGISKIKDEQLCPDLPALKDTNIQLIATAFKDMINYPVTFAWLKQRGVTWFVDSKNEVFDGFLFNLPSKESWTMPIARTTAQLCLRPIDSRKRLAENSWIEIAYKKALEASKQGIPFHPAFSAALDQLSSGISSFLALESLIDNIRYVLNK